MKEQSQTQMILEKLLQGKELTVLDMAQRPISSMYGSRRILDLKESGINVQDEWVDVPSNKKVKKYFLTEMDIKSIKRKLNGKKTK
jgi:hypothetical protein|tara:strand:+ start:505 stop:762 length:258 start_codon:yes stop_codon:yes gene_type:complete